MNVKKMQVAGSLTEDEVRDIARDTLGFENSDVAQSNVGQITTFNQLGFKGVNDRPDGWYLPHNPIFPAIILETKQSKLSFSKKEIDEILKNCRIAGVKYNKVIGILFNGHDILVFKNGNKLTKEYMLHNKEYYLGLFTENTLDKKEIYRVTKRINDSLHFKFGIKNLSHRMIFTACALVAKRYGAVLANGMSFNTFRTSIYDKLTQSYTKEIQQNEKINILLKTFEKIDVNLIAPQDAIDDFISDITAISDNINSDYWNGEDVMAIFFNEFNRYKKKSDSGQVFTPDHITSFMYRLIDVNKDDRILDAACGSGAFLVKSMCNMINEAGGSKTTKAEDIKHTQLFGIEFDSEVFALACANMLIHKDGKTNLELLDSRTDSAYEWIKDKNITKVLMNPPFESKYGCLDIVLNVLNGVADRDSSLHHLCAFILPDKKLEKKNQVSRVRKILKKHRITQIIKLPEKTFGGVNTSIFVFEAGRPQLDKKIFGCFIEEDGLDTVKNQGRQDVYGNWKNIEDYWIRVINREVEDQTIQYLDPKEHLSYQIKNDVTISRALFNATIIETQIYKSGLDFSVFCENLSKSIVYQMDFPEAGRALYGKLLEMTKSFGDDKIIDTATWGKFKMSKILLKIDRGHRLRKHDRRVGDMPLVTAGYLNQGITEYIDNYEQRVFSDSITIDMFCNCFYRDYQFMCDDNVIVFKPINDISDNAILFIVSIINAYSQRFGDKYNYANQFRENNFLKEYIYIPMDSFGNPDWAFMEGYINNLPYSNII